MGRDASGRLKSAYSATEISYNIETHLVASCVACVLSSSSRCGGESAIVVFSSHTHFMTTILSS